MKERLLATVASVLHVPVAALTLNSGPEDVEAWDSLAQINIVSEVESEFGVSIPIEDVAVIHRIHDFLGYLERAP